MPKKHVRTLRWSADRFEVELDTQRDRTAQQSSLAVGGRLAPLFLAVSPGLGAGNALVVTLLAQHGLVAVTELLNHRLPRAVG
ncbi:hypothetical protein [Streptomyces sp. NPDC056105]|uniref:hypothetical protein n=1 Tax=Streptomyces sp. NPDC056105 TaxID=3345714 RepID=UPI0035DF25D9